MAALPTVLLYGHDEGLIETRRMVLRRGGFDVHPVTGFSEFKRAGSLVEPDVVVLCHTLSQKDVEEALRLTREQWPKAQQLILTAGPHRFLDQTVSDVLDANEGPEQLINHVAQLATVRSALLQAAQTD